MRCEGVEKRNDYIDNLEKWESILSKKIVSGIAAGLILGMLAACGGDASDTSQQTLLANGEACNAAWNSASVYFGGDKVSYLGVNYTAAYWTQGNSPASNSGPAGSGQPWIPGFTCGGTPTTTSGTTTTTKISTTTKATTTTTLGPSSCPAYVAGTTYAVGKIVTNAGGHFSCTVSGWCSTGATAYEPGVGWAWTSAWSVASAAACTGGTTTTTASTTSTTVAKTTTTTTSSTTSTTTSSTQVKPFYVDQASNAAIWVSNNAGDGRAAAIKANIADQPMAKWLGGWVADIGAAVGDYVGKASALQQIPVLVAYNIPERDCGQYSAGGANSIEGYRTWIRTFAAAIGNRQALVILEPDALPQLDCLSAQGKTDRLQMMLYAVNQFKTLAPNAWLYLDIGNSDWLTSGDAANRLISAGIANAHGFSLNVSNYKTDADTNAYGIAVSNALQQQQGFTKPFVVDTSRNGNGPGNTWCDPTGRKLGVKPKRNPTGSQPEMILWIKSPGDSDGCAGPAGAFVPELAYKLIYGY